MPGGVRRGACHVVIDLREQTMRNHVYTSIGFRSRRRPLLVKLARPACRRCEFGEAASMLTLDIKVTLSDIECHFAAARFTWNNDLRQFDRPAARWLLLKNNDLCQRHSLERHDVQKKCHSVKPRRWGNLRNVCTVSF